MSYTSHFGSSSGLLASKTQLVRPSKTGLHRTDASDKSLRGRIEMLWEEHLDAALIGLTNRHKDKKTIGRICKKND